MSDPKPKKFKGASFVLHALTHVYGFRNGERVLLTTETDRTTLDTEPVLDDPEITERVKFETGPFVMFICDKAQNEYREVKEYDPDEKLPELDGPAHTLDELSERMRWMSMWRDDKYEPKPNIPPNVFRVYFSSHDRSPCVYNPEELRVFGRVSRGYCQSWEWEWEESDMEDPRIEIVGDRKIYIPLPVDEASDNPFDMPGVEECIEMGMKDVCRL